MTRTQENKTERKGLWEVKFILSGVPLPENEVIVNDKLRFMRLTKNAENLRLPVQAFVKVEGTSSQARLLAERFLKDFIGIYSNIVRSAIRIIRDNGAVDLPSKFVPPGTKYLGAMSRLITVVIESPRSKEELNKNLKLASKLLNSLDLANRSMSYLRVALDYFLNSKSAEEIEDKLIYCMIAIEALFGEKDELKYRISHRVACLLGNNDDSREEIFNKMKALYDKRSHLIHGRKTNLSWDDIRTAQSYLTDSIDCFSVLSLKFPRENILRALDDALINNKKREELQNECKKLLEEIREVAS